MELIQTTTPILAVNPYNGQQVNLDPLFKLMADEARAPVGTENISLYLQDVHDYVSSHAPDYGIGEVDVKEWADINRKLIQLRNVFTSMRPPVPDKA